MHLLALCKEKSAARKKMLGMWGGRALPMGMPKESGAPRKGKGAARRERGGEKEMV